MMKKFIVFIISLNLLGSEFKKMDDNFTRKMDLKYEEFILKNVNHKDFITISETLGNIIIFFNQEKEINKIVYFNKNNKIKREEIYKNANIYKLNIARYLYGENLNEQSNIKTGIEKVIEYYNYEKNKIRKIIIFSGLEKEFEIEFDEIGNVKNILKETELKK